MEKVTNEQLDNALFDTIRKQPKNDFESFQRMLSVATLVSWYQHREMFYPPMGSTDSETFHKCCDDARRVGLMK